MRSRIGAALARGGNDDLSVEIYPDADHMLLEWPLGDGRPPPVFTSDYPEVLVQWVLDRTSAQRQRARGELRGRGGG